VNGYFRRTRRRYDQIYTLLCTVPFEPFSVRLPFWKRGQRGVNPPNEHLERLRLRLEGTGDPSNVFVARRCRLAEERARLVWDLFQHRQTHDPEEPLDPDLRRRLDELDAKAVALIEFVKASGYRTPKRNPSWDPYADLQRVRDYASERKRHYDDRKPERFAHKRHLYYPVVLPAEPEEIGVAAVSVEEVKTFWDHWLRCGDRLDVMWSRNALYAMPAKGEVQKVFESRRPLRGSPFLPMDGTDRRYEIAAVEWDGRRVWMATAEEGLWILSPEGAVLAKVGADQGLPRYEPDVALHPLEPGRCLVIGASRQGQSRRSWLAVVERQGESAYRARVVHAAVKVPDGQDDADQAFYTSWTSRWTDPQKPGRPMLLIGRWDGDRWARRTAGAERRPLVVDLETFAVAVSPGHFPAIKSSSGTRALVPVDGKLLCCDRTNGPIVVEPPGRGEATHWTCYFLAEKRRSGPTALLLEPVLECPDGYLSPGWRQWWLVDRELRTVEQLPDEPVAGTSGTICCAVSAHYGPVLWRPGQFLHQVLVKPQLDAETRLAVLYAAIPEPDRARHDRAVRAIRALGGDVGGSGSASTGRTRAPWATRVRLPKAWRGGSDGLAHLADLCNLRELYLEGTPVSGKAVEHVGKCTTIEKLVLLETPIRSADLAPLENLESLKELWLEGTARGIELGDAALAHVPMDRLERLTLWGPSFTTAGLEELAGAERLRQLYLNDTSIPRATAYEFGKSRGRLTVSSR